MKKEKSIIKILALSFLLFNFTLLLSPAEAAVSQDGWDPNAVAGSVGGAGLPDPEGGFFTILLTFIDWAIMIVGLLGVIVFIYGGFTYLTAQGEPGKIETAKKIIVYGIVGIAVSVVGLVAVRTIDNIMRGNSGTGGGAAAPAGSTGAPTAGPGGTSSPAGVPAAAPASGQTTAPMPIAPGMMGR